MSRPRGRGTNGGAGRGPHRVPRAGKGAGGGGKRPGCLMVLPDLAAYLWSTWQGRTALLCIAVGALGLTTHFWTAYPLLLALDLSRPVLRTGVEERRVRAGRGWHPLLGGGATPP